MVALARYQAFALDDAGNVLASPTVDVWDEISTLRATLFSDRAGASGISNPFTGGSDGLVAFHVVGGTYKITVTKGAVVRTLRYVGISTGSETDFDNTAWLTYTPVITAIAGAFTSVSATGRYKQIGKVVYVYIKITITTNGTAATYVLATLPVAAIAAATATPVICGRATSISGKMLQGIIAGTTVSILNYDGTYPGATGEALVVSGAYEAA
jgi:hypothetical protein